MHTTRRLPALLGIALILFCLPKGSTALGQKVVTEPTTGLHANTPKVHALVGAKIVVAPGEVIDKGTVVLRDGLIEAVGADVTPPADARIWNLEGKTLYPGLIDAFSEITLPETATSGPGYWNAQIVPQNRAEEGYKPDADANKKFRSQGIVARHILPATGLIKGTTAIVSTGDGDPRELLMGTSVAIHAEPTLRRGGSRDGYPNSPMGAYTLVRQALLDSRWYQQAWRTFSQQPTSARPEWNAALSALVNAQAARLPWVIDAADDQYLLRADRLGSEFGLNVIIRGSGEEFRRLDAVKATGRPVIVPLNFPQPPDVTTLEQAQNASLENLLTWDIAPENPARLDQAGVKIALTAQGLKDVSGFLAAVRKAVDRGLPAESALRALTTTPAELLRIDTVAGSIRPGRVASLVIASGDLFDKSSKVVATWIDGVHYDVEATSTIEPRGTWEISFNDPTNQPATVILVLEGEPGKLSGTVARGDKKTKLTRATIRESQLSATFKGDELGWPGIVQLTAGITLSESGEASGAGEIAWPEGPRAKLTARRTEAYKPKADEAAKEKGSGKPEEGSADETPAEKKEPVVKPVEVKPGENTIATETPAPESPVVKPVEGTKPAAEDAAAAAAKPDEAAAKSPESSTKKADADSKRRALYPVNYPLGAWGRASTPDRPKAVLFQNATVWTSGPAGILEGASVLVEAGVIKAVGKDVKAPEGALIVDLTGKHLTPGVIDCHSHIATDGGVNESGQAITAEVRIGDFIDANDVNIYRQLAGGVTSSNILHGSANPIGGQNQVIKLRWGALPEDMKFAEAPQGIKFALGENVKQSNWGERFTSRYPQTRMGVEQIVRDEFLAAQEYRRRWDEWRQTQTGAPPRTDLELEAVAEILEGKRLVHCHSYRQDEILALMRTCADFKVQIATLQHILEGYKVADVMAQYKIGGSSFSDWWAFKFEVFDAIPYNGAVMHNAGVVVSFNSDDAELARRLNLEAAKAVKYGGVPPAEALKFVTLNPAKQLRIDRWVGSIEADKHADLVVWSGSPLSNYSHCEQSWIDGRKYFDRQEDLALRDDVEKMRAALVQRVLSSGEDPAGADAEPRLREMWPREDLFCHHHTHRDDHGGDESHDEHSQEHNHHAH